MNQGITAGLQSLGQQLTNQSGQIQQNQGDLTNILGGINAIQAGQTATQAQIGAIGRFLGWEFYQIPNRYSAYIPNQQPGGQVPAGSSVIGSV
jgi:hypothetical protein